MKKPRVEIGKLRRAQIVEAAVATIAEQGLEHLSLSAIEKRAGMSRGQLTYYFRAKEDILLAVFDHLLGLMRQRVGAGDCPMESAEQMPHGWERACRFLTILLLQPPAAPEFHSLQYTFLSQIGHRDDFRRRLANLYEEWRGHIAEDFEPEVARKTTGPKASARTFGTLLQAILHGLAMQRAADPDAYDRQEMLELILALLGNYLRPAAASPRPAVRKAHSANGSAGRGKPPRPAKTSRVKS